MSTIYILHYHLHPGGVSRIIESQVRGLLAARPDSKIVILTGDQSQNKAGQALPARVIEFAPLNYLSNQMPADAREKELISIEEFLSRRLHPGDILHAHNINLGKNPLLTLAVFRQAQRGVRLVNHCHDFAEDRPDNFAFLSRIIKAHCTEPTSAVLYPDMRNYAFVVLNSSDRQRLIQYGVAESKINLLPNPVGAPAIKLDKKTAQAKVRELLHLGDQKRLITYPVRVIRRKNVGEFILLAHLFRDAAHWMITQPPRNPIEIAPYEKWKEFCRVNGIPVHFDVGERLDFELLMRASDACISTSIKEGFGMAFLEPWTYGTPVIGRDIPYVTSDLRKMGLHLPNLYEKLMVEFKQKKCDFSLLSMEEQIAVITSVMTKIKALEHLLQHNPFLRIVLQNSPSDLVEKNRNLLKTKFSISAYGKRLFAIYDSTA